MAPSHIYPHPSFLSVPYIHPFYLSVSPFFFSILTPPFFSFLLTFSAVPLGGPWCEIHHALTLNITRSSMSSDKEMMSHHTALDGFIDGHDSICSCHDVISSNHFLREVRLEVKFQAYIGTVGSKYK